MTVDDFYAEANPGRKNEPLWVSQIRAVLTAHGIATDYKNPFDDALLFKCMREHKPVIALINYGRLVENKLTEFTNFKVVALCGDRRHGPGLHLCQRPLLHRSPKARPAPTRSISSGRPGWMPPWKETPTGPASSR